MSNLSRTRAMLKAVAPIVVALALSACVNNGNKPMTGSHEMVSANGTMFEVECSGVFASSNNCRERAKEICKDKEIVWLAAIKGPSGAVPDKSDTARVMQFACGKKEVAEAPVTPPAPPAPPPPAPPRPEKITLSSTQLFEFDSATLRLPQPRLDEIAAALVGNQAIGNIVISGYTDRLGSEAYNQRLSQRRADAVKTYLASRGVAAGRLNAVGKGSTNPLVQCREKNQTALIRCLEPNRRVEIEQFSVNKETPKRP